MKERQSPRVKFHKSSIAFLVKNESASQISVAGTFNNWEKDRLKMKHHKSGFWKLSIPMLPKGKYYYKFFIDGKMWMEDIYNPYREPDGSVGFNSVLFIEK